MLNVKLVVVVVNSSLCGWVRGSCCMRWWRCGGLDAHLVAATHDD